jgi:hypothetical protein
VFRGSVKVFFPEDEPFITTESMVKEIVPLTGENFTPDIFTSLHLLPIFLNIAFLSA